MSTVSPGIGKRKPFFSFVTPGPPCVRHKALQSGARALAFWHGTVMRVRMWAVY